jgi:hypothetical protein
MSTLSTSIAGKWESINNEIRPNPWGGKYYLRRYFDNTDSAAHATLVFYTDESYNNKNLTLEVTGPYKFLKPDAFIEGATDTDFDFTEVAATPHSQAMVDMLNGMPADYLKPWMANVRQEVSKAGQSIMGIVIGEYKEYDVTKVDGDLLYYGERPADGSAPDKEDKRAKSLQVPLKRVNAFSL